MKRILKSTAKLIIILTMLSLTISSCKNKDASITNSPTTPAIDQEMISKLDSFILISDSMRSKQRVVIFDDSSLDNEIELHTTEAVNKLVLELNCKIEKGNVYVQLFSPDGKTHGDLSINYDEPQKQLGQKLNDKKWTRTNSIGDTTRLEKPQKRFKYITTEKTSSKNGTINTSESIIRRNDKIIFGSLNKTVNQPMVGTWRIKITTENATGKLTYRSKKQ